VHAHAQAALGETERGGAARHAGADEVSRTLVELELEGRVVVRDGMYRRAS